MGSWSSTTPGSTTVNVPSGATNVRKRVWAGGGGGGGGPTSADGRQGGGGGQGGGYSEQTDDVTGTYDVTIGSGGTGVTGSGVAGSGTDSVVSLSGTDKARAKGGAGASSRTGGSSADNVTNGVGDIRKNGGHGGNNSGSDHHGGGGGEAADETDDGNDGEAGDGTTYGLGGNGGTTGGDGGNGGKFDDGVTPPANGADGSSPGGGGGGGGSPGSYSATTGGNGGGGKVEFTWTDPATDPTIAVSIDSAFSITPNWGFSTFGISEALGAAFGLSPSAAITAAISELLACVIGLDTDDRIQAVFDDEVTLRSRMSLDALLFRAYSDSTTMTAAHSLSPDCSRAYSISQTLTAAYAVSDQLGFPLTLTLACAVLQGAAGELAKTVSVALQLLAGVTPRPLRLTPLPIALAEVIAHSPQSTPNQRVAVQFASQIQQSGLHVVAKSIATAIGAVAQTSPALRQAVAALVAFDVAVNKTATPARVGSGVSTTLTSQALVSPDSIRTSSLPVSILPKFGLSPLVGLQQIVTTSVGASMAVLELLKTSPGISVLLTPRVTQSNAMTASPGLHVDAAAVVAFGDVLRRLTPITSQLSAAVDLDETHDLTQHALIAELQAVMSLIDSVSKEQLLTMVAGVIADLSVYYEGPRVMGVALSASARVTPAIVRTSNETTLLIVQAMLEGINTLDELENIHLTPDGVWTQATIKDEIFYTQEEDY